MRKKPNSGNAPRAYPPMPETPDGPDSLEGMAFQLILQKLGSLERAMQAMPPLLKKIVDQLEAQTQHSEVEVATYEQLYPDLPKEAPAAAQTHAENPAPGRRRRLWHWFMQECP